MEEGGGGTVDEGAGVESGAGFGVRGFRRGAEWGMRAGGGAAPYPFTKPAHPALRTQPER